MLIINLNYTNKHIIIKYDEKTVSFYVLKNEAYVYIAK